MKGIENLLHRRGVMSTPQVNIFSPTTPPSPYRGGLDYTSHLILFWRILPFNLARRRGSSAMQAEFRKDPAGQDNPSGNNNGQPKNSFHFLFLEERPVPFLY
jgi:hypothetical protein